VQRSVESQRGQGDGHRPGWYGAPNGTMTNGAVEPTGTVGAASTSGGDPVFVVKYKEGDKRIVVPSNAHIVRYEVGSKSDIKAGAPFATQAAVKQTDGSFTAERIKVGKNGGRPFGAESNREIRNISQSGRRGFASGGFFRLSRRSVQFR